MHEYLSIVSRDASRVVRTAIVMVAVAAIFGACSPSSLVDVTSPSGVVDPSTVQTASGAQQLYAQSLQTFARRFGGTNPFLNETGSSYIVVTGVFTDELEKVAINTFQSFFSPGVDERTNATDYEEYPHQARAQVRQARDALRLYAPNTPVAWQGQLYALEGYTVLWLAEGFCSGMPLTIVPLVGSPQLTPGYPTDTLLTRAIAYFDSAATLAADSTQYVNLAKVGKARALLDMGRWADAAQAVQGVPTDFVYAVPDFSAAQNPNYLGNPTTRLLVQVVDNEGTNGLAWSTDPRTGVTTAASTGAMKIAAKYARTAAGTLDPTADGSAASIHLADGLEARLIEAEAALATGTGDWLGTLNMLRSTCIGTAACAPVPGLTATNLPATLTDPGSDTARVSLLFKERAMWLYLTGHREGDLRRMVHFYHRDPNTLWPTGTYVNPGFPPNVPGASSNGTPYGAYYVLMPGTNEATNNPLYSGCIDVDP